VIIQIPFQDEHSIPIDMHMAGRMITFPGDKHIPTPPNLPHVQVLSSEVPLVKARIMAITATARTTDPLISAFALQDGTDALPLEVLGTAI
jgi:hypothetical protein